jgi:hypothetical protein
MCYEKSNMYEIHTPQINSVGEVLEIDPGNVNRNTNSVMLRIKSIHFSGRLIWNEITSPGFNRRMVPTVTPDASK